ncbi:MAG: hypothetical protein M1828_005759 [Chrysothrix sp. TS-e1954]|nr:MAG: hypothetical protein M1828_005759 [Chrysothrix sp. TS-e1954]
MAPTATLLNLISFFYPFGNTPAVNLLQELALETPAEVLLLGCGDARSLLFSVYSDANNDSRPLSFTCCDHEPVIVARNALLFTLIVDGAWESNETSLWNIYCHLYVKDEDSNLIQRQARKLFKQSESITSWKRSSYGKLLSFHDEETRKCLRQVWQSFCVNDLPLAEREVYSQRLSEQIRGARNYEKESLGEKLITSLVSSQQSLWEYSPPSTQLKLTVNFMNMAYSARILRNSHRHDTRIR